MVMSFITPWSKEDPAIPLISQSSSTRGTVHLVATGREGHLRVGFDVNHGAIQPSDRRRGGFCDGQIRLIAEVLN
jgi:hypothetical protein